MYGKEKSKFTELVIHTLERERPGICNGHEKSVTRILWRFDVKYVTISIPEELARWARLWAVEHESSVSGLLSRLLQEKKESELRYQSSMDSFLSRPVTRISGGESYPGRDSLYDR